LERIVDQLVARGAAAAASDAQGASEMNVAL